MIKPVKASIEAEKLLEWETALKMTQHNINEAKMGTVIGGSARARLDHTSSLLEEIIDEVKREYLNAF